MTATRRLKALETSLTPVQLVNRWLDEAHAYGSFVAYSQSLLDLEPEQFPLTRLSREARRGALYGSRGRRDSAVARAVRETVFRFLLVLRINVTAYEQNEREALIHAALASYCAMLANTPAPKREYVHRGRISHACNLLFGRIGEMETWAVARKRVEARYLDGRQSLFPDVAAATAEHLELVRQSAALALRLAELDGVEPHVGRAERADVDHLVADLVEPTKAMALEKLGEGERAIPIASAWLRGKYERSEADDADEPATNYSPP